MFSKFKTGVKKAGNRHSRHAPQDDEQPRPATQRGHAKVTGLHNNRSVDVLSSMGGQSIVSSEPPILPRIPRVASKTSQHEAASPTSPLHPTIRTVDTQKTLLEETSPQSERSVQVPEHNALKQVRSFDQTMASFQADTSRVDATLMPPPPRPNTKANIAFLDPQRRAQTDVGQRPASTRTLSSQSSFSHEFPVHQRIPEPEDYVTPPQAIQLGNQPPPRPRSRLTKLNPLSYLSRKKSSQSPIDELDQNAIAKRASFTPTKPLSESYDPRIKGKLVHDFSAPRPSHFVSIQNLRSAAADGSMQLPPSGIYDSRRGSDSNLPKRPLGDPSPERRHVPVFKEDFSTSAEGWRLNPDDRRNQSSSDIVDKVAALEEAAKSEKRKSALPAFAVHMPEDIPSPDEQFSTPRSSKTTPRLSSELEPALTPNSIQQTPDSLKPPKHTPRQDALTPSPQGSPLADRSRATSPDAPQTFSSLPKHLRSKTASIRSQASRFSFDMAPGGSAAQEKILEERHRQHAAKRARATSLTSISINEEDGFDEDDIDFDGDMEDDIPGMNGDDYDFGGRGGVANMTLDASEDNDYDEEIPGMDDEDGDDFDTGPASGGGLGNMTLEGFKSGANSHVDIKPLAMNSKPQGLGLMTTELPMNDSPNRVSASTLDPASSNDPRTISALQNRVEEDINELSNDNFYFDDGEFDDELGLSDEDDDVDDIDESMLDQDFQRGKRIESLKPLPAEHPETVDSSRSSTRPDSMDSELLAERRRSELTDDTSRTSVQFQHARRSSAYGQHDEFDATAGLTQENLSAYHNALAFAANQAAKQGRFERQTSAEGRGAASSPPEPSRQRNVSFNEPMAGSGPNVSLDTMLAPSDLDDDDFNFDDSLDDDAIIDAANAEALENDDDGFYGQEFGFYASSHGSGEAQAFHGGYFGSAGLNQIKRSHSGREAFQEPSLTPITERSEWSNRNSMISLALHGTGISPGSVASPGATQLPTPGLAQLADQMQQEGSPGEDMSLSALMKARRGAFGGSSTSLHSMGNTGPGSRSGSPSLYAFQQQQGNSPLGGSGIAPPPPLREEIEESDQQRPRAGSLTNPMLTLQTQNLSLRPTTSGSDSSPLKRNAPLSARAHGHSRTNSAASGTDSVSYAMQRNEDGGEMWVVEKRRTLDNGDVEILNRNILQGTL